MQARLTKAEIEAMVRQLQAPGCSDDVRAELSRRITLDRPEFLKLPLHAGEVVIWCTGNPTFHRFSEYGIAITSQAIYLSSPLLVFFGRWRRYPIESMQGAEFRDSWWRPRLLLHLKDRQVSFRTPHDSYKEEMDFDRKNLAKAAGLLNELIGTR